MGITLIEVLAGVGLLGTLLTTVILAYGRHVQQAYRAQERLVAVGLLDELLGDWFRREEVLATSAEGTFDKNYSKFIWRRSVVQRDQFASVGLGVVAVEVWDTTRPSTDKFPVCRVELAIYDSPATRRGQIP